MPPKAEAGRTELRQFGLIAGALIAVVPGGVIPWLGHHRVPVWPWALGAVLIASGAVCPTALKYPFAIWNAAGKLMGWLNTRLVLAALFYLVVTPVALIVRLLGRDPMARRFDPKLPSYRTESRPIPPHSMERPF